MVPNPRREAIHILMDLLQFIDGKKVDGVKFKAVIKNDLIKKLHSEAAFDRWMKNTLVRWGHVKELEGIVIRGRRVTIYTKTLRGERLLEILKDRETLLTLCLTRGKRLRRECPWAK